MDKENNISTYFDMQTLECCIQLNNVIGKVPMDDFKHEAFKRKEYVEEIVAFSRIKSNSNYIWIMNISSNKDNKIINMVQLSPNDEVDSYQPMYPSLFHIDITYKKMITKDDILNALNECAGKWK